MSGRNNNGKEPAPTTPDFVNALHHPLRRQILWRMLNLQDNAHISPRELQDILDRPLSNVSYHVKVLLGDKAVELVATKQVRGSVQHFYRPTEALSKDPWVTAILRRKRGG